MMTGKIQWSHTIGFYTFLKTDLEMFLDFLRDNEEEIGSMCDSFTKTCDGILLTLFESHYIHDCNKYIAIPTDVLLKLVDKLLK